MAMALRFWPHVGPSDQIGSGRCILDEFTMEMGCRFPNLTQA
jgi:hypothetical protein